MVLLLKEFILQQNSSKNTIPQALLQMLPHASNIFSDKITESFPYPLILK